MCAATADFLPSISLSEVDYDHATLVDLGVGKGCSCDISRAVFEEIGPLWGARIQSQPWAVELYEVLWIAG